MRRVAAGEEIGISIAGKPIARLVPWVERPQPRPLGLYRGQLWIADDFDETPEDVIAGFEGRDDA